MTSTSSRPEDDSEPPAVRMLVESGPRGCLITSLVLGGIVCLGVVGVGAVIRLLSLQF